MAAFIYLLLIVFTSVNVVASFIPYNCSGNVCPNTVKRDKGDMAGCIGFCTFGNERGDEMLLSDDMYRLLHVCEKMSRSGRCDEFTFVHRMPSLGLTDTEEKSFYAHLSSFDGTNSSISEEDFLSYFQSMGNGSDLVTAGEHQVHFNQLYTSKIADTSHD